MVAVFLAAELGSPRVGPVTRRAMCKLGIDEELITRPDICDAGQNSLRERLLGRTRGWKMGRHLLGRFPPDVAWYDIELDIKEVDDLLYSNCTYWREVSSGSLRVHDAADNIRAGRVAFVEQNTFFMDATVEMFRDVTAAVERGRDFPPIIIVASAENAVRIILEGSLRATAYALALNKPDKVGAVLGVAPEIAQWAATGVDAKG
jgi:hypothetical protein